MNSETNSDKELAFRHEKSSVVSQHQLLYSCADKREHVVHARCEARLTLPRRKKHEPQSHSRIEKMDLKLSVSYVEVYGNEVNDLLSEGNIVGQDREGRYAETRATDRVGHRYVLDGNVAVEVGSMQELVVFRIASNIHPIQYCASHLAGTHTRRNAVVKDVGHMPEKNHYCFPWPPGRQSASIFNSSPVCILGNKTIDLQLRLHIR